MFVGRRRCLIFLIYHGVSFTGIRTHSPVQRMSCDSRVTPRPAVLGPTTDRLIACERVPGEPRDLRIVVGVCASPGADAATAAQQPCNTLLAGVQCRDRKSTRLNSSHT